MECGGKRSATPLWIAFGTREMCQEWRRRASLAAALHSFPRSCRPPPPRRFGDRRSRSVSDSLERAAKEAVAGDHAIGVCAGVRQVPKLATGAFHNQTTRGDVPQPDAAFDVGVEPPGRHV